MAEYIERESAIEAIMSDPPDAHYQSWYAEKINEIPAADVEPVMRGRWDDSGRYTFPSGNTAVRCTNCGCALAESEYHLYGWNYCPICGSKMDGDSDG